MIDIYEAIFIILFLLQVVGIPLYAMVQKQKIKGEKNAKNRIYYIMQ